MIGAFTRAAFKTPRVFIHKGPRVKAKWTGGNDIIPFTNQLNENIISLIKNLICVTKKELLMVPRRAYLIFIFFASFSLLTNCESTSKSVETDRSQNDNAIIVMELSFTNESEFNQWSESSYLDEGVNYSWDANGGIHGSPCILIENQIPNDSRLVLPLDLLPGEQYILQGWIRGEGILHHEGEQVGPNLSIYDTYSYVAEPGRNSSWTFVEMTFQYEEGMQLACRLGHYGGTATGKAYFDDLQILQLEMTSGLEGEHIILSLESDDLVHTNPESLNRWLDNLDMVYEELQEFSGLTPFNSQKMEIASVRQNPGGWAVAGNPILWMKEYIKDELKLMTQRDDWIFGIIHEISHNFDDNSWNFDAEHFANFKLCYVVEELNANVKDDDGVYYTGAEIDDFFYKMSQRAYDYYIETNEYYNFNDYITYWFLQIKMQIGWAPFQATFHYLSQNPVKNSDGNVELFERFLEDLQSNTTEDISVFINSEEYELIIHYLETLSYQ